MSNQYDQYINAFQGEEAEKLFRKLTERQKEAAT